MAIPSGQLPYEDRPRDWLTTLASEFHNARAPFDTLRDWVSENALSGRASKPMDEATIYGIGALVTKLLKVYRGILILCEAGHGAEALVLVRVALETAAQIVWVCRADDPRIALLKVLAHEQLRRAVLFEKNGDADAQTHAQRVADAYGRHIVELGSQYDAVALKKHWHGLGSFEALCTLLEWTQHYQFLYRFTSMPTHAADVSLHIREHDDGLPSFPIGPGDYLVDDCLALAPVLLHQTIEALQSTLTILGPRSAPTS